MLQKIGSNLLLLLFIATSVGTSGIASYKILKNLPQANANQAEKTVEATTTPSPEPSLSVSGGTTVRTTTRVETGTKPTPTKAPSQSSPGLLRTAAAVLPTASPLTPVSGMRGEDRERENETESSEKLYEQHTETKVSEKTEVKVTEKPEPTERPEPTEVPESSGN